ncbi:MAG TPA: hypothetical protein VF792_05825 [Ktedonobacterales bacterium]
MGMVVVLGIASIIFLTTILIVAAVMMRGQWDKLGQREPPREG